MWLTGRTVSRVCLASGLTSRVSWRSQEVVRQSRVRSGLTRFCRSVRSLARVLFSWSSIVTESREKWWEAACSFISYLSGGMTTGILVLLSPKPSFKSLYYFFNRKCPSRTRKDQTSLLRFQSRSLDPRAPLLQSYPRIRRPSTRLSQPSFVFFQINGLPSQAKTMIGPPIGSCSS